MIILSEEAEMRVADWVAIHHVMLRNFRRFIILNISMLPLVIKKAPTLIPERTSPSILKEVLTKYSHSQETSKTRVGDSPSVIRAIFSFVAVLTAVLEQ